MAQIVVVPVEELAAYRVVRMRQPKMHHLLHLIAFFVTGGLWLPIWIGQTKAFNARSGR